MYTEEFRRDAARKAQLRGTRSFASVAEEVGVAKVTLRSWVDRSVNGFEMKNRSRGTKTTSSKKFGFAEKFKILLECTNLSEADFGEYLRRHGLHSAQIVEWKKELEEGFREPSRTERSEENKLKFTVIRLEKEVHRKDKALAEASALLILKKKASILWGTDGEDEE